jgi:hypothetical protein
LRGWAFDLSGSRVADMSKRGSQPEGQGVNP